MKYWYSTQQRVLKINIVMCCVIRLIHIGITNFFIMFEISILTFLEKDVRYLLTILISITNLVTNFVVVDSQKKKNWIHQKRRFPLQTNQCFSSLFWHSRVWSVFDTQGLGHICDTLIVPSGLNNQHFMAVTFEAFFEKKCCFSLAVFQGYNIFREKRNTTISIWRRRRNIKVHTFQDDIIIFSLSICHSSPRYDRHCRSHKKVFFHFEL